MSKRKIPVSARKTSQLAESGDVKQKVIRLIGISLAGGKSDKACVAVLEYFTENKKLFLSRLFEKIKSEEKISGDLKIHELIEQNLETTSYVAFDTPWQIPNCMSCQKKCPGYENCHEPHIEWMWHYQNEKLGKKRPKKLFTPYTQRAVEMYLQTELEEPFQPHHAMGSNQAPLLARAAFIQRRLSADCIEVFPRLTIWRLGKALNLMKSQLRGHREAFGGDEARKSFLQSLSENNLAFIYHQDFKQMTENNHAFEAFICGLTAFLKLQGLTEKKPKGFPKNESWIEFPIKDIRIKDIIGS